jgi:hypothetical protein
LPLNACGHGTPRGHIITGEKSILTGKNSKTRLVLQRIMNHIGFKIGRNPRSSRTENGGALAQQRERR